MNRVHKMKKKNLIPLILSSQILFACQSEKLPSVENNTITYSETIDKELFSFEENKNKTKENNEETIKEYFTSYGTHMSNDTKYIFLYKGTINNKDIKLDITYDSSLENNSYYLAATYQQDDEDNRPSRSYFFSTYINDLTDFKKEEYTSTYMNNYLDGKEEKYFSIDIKYTNTTFDSYNINTTKYQIENKDIPSKAKQDNDKIAIYSLEPIRYILAYNQKLLDTIGI